MAAVESQQHALNEARVKSENRALTRRRRLSTVGAFFLLFNYSMTTNSFGFFVILGPEKFGVSTARYLVWVSIFTLAAALMNPLFGKLIQRFGVRNVALVAPIVYGVALVGMGSAPSVTMLFVLGAIAGIAVDGTGMIAANSAVVGWHRGERSGKILGVVGLGLPVGGIAVGVFMPPIVTHAGFSGGFMVVGASTVVLSLIISIFLLRQPPQPVEDEAAASVRAEVVRGTIAKVTGWFALVIVLLLAAGLLLGYEHSYIKLTAAIVQDGGLSVELAGAVAAYTGLVFALGQVAVGWVLDRFGLTVTLVVMSVSCVLGLPVLSVLHHLGVWTYFVFTIPVALAMAVMSPVLPTIVRRAVGPVRFPFAYGFALAGVYLGVAGAVPFWGSIKDSTGSYDTALLLVGPLSVAGLVIGGLAVWFGRRRLRTGEEQSATYAADTENGSVR